MLQINKHPNLKSDIFENHPSIILVRKFSEASLEDFTKHFIEAEASGQEIIPIQIDSNGGHIDALLGMLDMVGRSKKIVSTFTNTKAYSCGALLLASGTPGYRFASQHSSVMVHEMASATYGKHNEMVNDMGFFDNLNKKFLTMLNEFCNQKKGYFEKRLRENGNADLYFTASQAKYVGIIDKIKSPTFEIEITQKFKLC